MEVAWYIYDRMQLYYIVVSNSVTVSMIHDFVFVY